MAKSRRAQHSKHRSPVFLIGLSIVLLVMCIGSVLLMLPPDTPTDMPVSGGSVSKTTTSTSATIGPTKPGVVLPSSTMATTVLGDAVTSFYPSTTTDPTGTGTTWYVPKTDPNATKKLVALTFDDGPGDYTEELLDVLAENEVKATFFVVGSRAEKNKSVLKRMVAEGHEIGGHSYSHPKLTTISKSKIAKEIADCKKAIKAAAGVEIELMRAPYGAVDKTVKSCAKAANLKLINWSVDTNDWRYAKEDRYLAQSQILRYIFKGKYKVTDGGIVLMHDVHEHSVEAVPAVIYYLKQNGYEFVTVSELLDLRLNGGEAGELYRQADPTTIAGSTTTATTFAEQTTTTTVNSASTTTTK